MSELSKEARALLQAARPAEEPAPSDKVRVLAALSTKLALPVPDPSAAGGAGTGGGAGGAATGGAGVGGGAGAGAAKVGAGLTAAAKVKIVVAVVAASAAGAGTYSLVDHDPPVSGGAEQRSSKAQRPMPASFKPARAARVGSKDVSLAPPPKTGRRARLADVAPTAPAIVGRRRAGKRTKPVAAAARVGETPDEPGALRAGASSPPPESTGPGVPPATVLVEPPPQPPVKPEPPKRSACDTRAELALLGQVQSALRAKDGQRALVELGRHARRCPSPVFGEEARAARVLALCLVGREAEARREAEQLRRASPRSPHLARLRSSCAFVDRR